MRLKLAFFFICYLAAPWPTLGNIWGRGGSLTDPMLITAFVKFFSKGHWEYRYEVGLLSPDQNPMGFDAGTFRLLSQRLHL